MCCILWLDMIDGHKKLKKAILAIGLTVDQIAQQIGLSNVGIYLLMRGAGRKPNFDTCEKLEKVLPYDAKAIYHWWPRPQQP